MSDMPNQDDAQDWKENVKYLLDNCPKAVRAKYKGGYENLIESLCITFIKLQNEKS